jgi:hypothetical protein
MMVSLSPGGLQLAVQLEQCAFCRPLSTLIGEHATLSHAHLRAGVIPC